MVMVSLRSNKPLMKTGGTSQDWGTLETPLQVSGFEVPMVGNVPTELSSTYGEVGEGRPKIFKVQAVQVYCI